MNKLLCPALLAALATSARAQDVSTNGASSSQLWNWHVQNTDIVQGYPGFSAAYSGHNSLPAGGETRETVSIDVLAGVRLWPGAEAHIDGLMWQGFGVGNALGVDGFPNGEAFRIGTQLPDGDIARAFIRQTIGFGGDQEDVPDDQLTLAGKQDISRLTITIGRYSAKDIFDNNSYANDPRTQFLNWGLMANQAWDYPADSLGFETGLALEFNQPNWTLRYGLFQMPNMSNGMNMDTHLFKAWGMVTELERRFAIHNHPGVLRFLAYLNQAHMGSYQDAVDSPIRPANIVATENEAYRVKYGFGLNFEQEIFQNVGVFSRIGWSDGHTEAWVFSDVDETASFGLSIKGAAWSRPDDTFGLAGDFNGLSAPHQRYFEAGGLGVLAGDGALHYGIEKIMETYYDFKIWKGINAALDYQFVSNPAFNQDRGPVSVFGARLHLEF